MRRGLPAIWIVLVLYASTVRAALPASDNCNTAASAMTSGSWTQLTTNGMVYTGSTCAGQVDAEFEAMIWNADSFGDDQSSQGQVSDVAATHFIAPGVRMSDGGGADNFPGYYFFCGNESQGCSVQECTSANPSVCSVIGAFSETVVTGDTTKIGMVGTQIYTYINGLDVTCDSGSGCSAGVLTDATIASGGAGMAAYGAGSFDLWSADNFSVGSPSTPRRHITTRPPRK